MSLIWEATLDGQYFCEVKRVDDTNGVLTITDTQSNNIIFTESVGLSYGAQFGPDVYDVAEWETKILEFIDGEER